MKQYATANEAYGAGMTHLGYKVLEGKRPGDDITTAEAERVARQHDFHRAVAFALVDAVNPPGRTIIFLAAQEARR